jgi:hypothetical protein
MTLKQLFCRHMWKFINEEFLRYQYDGSIVSFKYSYYVRNYKCIKCEKNKMEERRYPVL